MEAVRRRRNQTLDALDEAGGKSVPIVEAAAGLIAVVVAVLGLSSIYPHDMAAIATVAVAAFLLIEGGAALVNGFDRTGAILETVIGGAGFVIGVVALTGVVGLNVVAIAVVLFGVAMFLRLRSTGSVKRSRSDQARHSLVGYRTTTRMGVHVLVAFAVAALGILVMFGVNPLTLTLVALLVAGTSEVLSGSARIGGAGFMQTA